MKKLIVNADDFGLTRAINESILQCIQDGIVTSVSLIACGRAAHEAMIMARDFGTNTSIGIHLTLETEVPVAAPDSIPTIITKNGNLMPRSQIMTRLLTGQISIEDVLREWSAQIDKVITAGLRPDHLDGHGQIHVYPPLLSVLIDVAKHYNIPVVRLPLEPFIAGHVFKRLKDRLLLRTSAQIAKWKFKSKLRHPDFMIGFSSSGCYSENIFLKDISYLKDGDIVEAMFHPGPAKIDIPLYNAWGYNWAVDSATLCSSRVKDFIKERGIKLVTFKTFLSD